MDRFRVLFLSCLSLIAATCTTGTSQSDTPSAAEIEARERTQEGVADMKEGSRETAEGIGETVKGAGQVVAEEAKEAGREVAASVREAGQAIKASACPVVGNKTSRFYYTQSSQQYEAMLAGEKVLAADKRECFPNETVARESGYRSAAQ